MSLYGSFLMIIYVGMLMIHSFAWSEPLYIFLTLVGLGLLAQYFEGGKLLPLVLAAAAIALGCLARYAGISSVVSGVVAIMLLGKNSVLRRFRDSFVFGVISLFPLALWMTRNHYVAGNMANREILFHPIPLDRLMAYLEWLSNSRTVLLLVMVVLLLSLSYLLLKRKIGKLRVFSSQSDTSYYYLLAISSLVYFIFIVVSKLFFSADILFDSRILAPIYPLCVVLAICVIGKLFSASEGNTFGRVLIPVIFMVVAISLFLDTAAWVAHAHRDGLEYSGKGWLRSKIIQSIRSRDSNSTIFTNGVEAIYILADRTAFALPRKLNLGTLKKNSNYGNEMLNMRDHLTNGGLIVLFKKTGRSDFPTSEELTSKLPLRLVEDYPDGAIYEVIR